MEIDPLDVLAEEAASQARMRDQLNTKSAHDMIDKLHDSYDIAVDAIIWSAENGDNDQKYRAGTFIINKLIDLHKERNKAEQAAKSPAGQFASNWE